ncbi:zinc finger HIT domain-containing protein 3 isoform X2 [Latimeria chalumnae]|uniref:Zinc finger HIT domain-containing protein 3 n=1 Tax=Latimeria chalumnae TaxID=7897 RepID=H3BD28_LATCH
MEICGICAGEAPKYRCPACRTRYCSVPCCKKHKESCIPSEEPVPATVTLHVSPSLRGVVQAENQGNSRSVDNLLDEDEESDRVCPQKLKLLESEDLKDLLCNPHLRQLLLSIDQAEDKASVMKVTMQEPLFVEFADQCLKIVESPGKENAAPQ